MIQLDVWPSTNTGLFPVSLVTSSPDVAWDNMVLSQYDVAYLKDCGIACTKDDYKYEYTIKDGTYEFPPLDGMVVALKHDGKFVDSISEGDHCGVLVDKTSFLC
ncbi:hypothetical protein LSAT2_004172 [Lamellibrachia satsuma]|nr:hypothetical protein LSAT2_004172 [Lamellibrachia satsuma]